MHRGAKGERPLQHGPRLRFVLSAESDEVGQRGVVDQASVLGPARKIGIGRQEILGHVAGAVLNRVDEIETEPPGEQAQILQSHPL